MTHDDIPIYAEGATLPELVIECEDDDGELVDFSTGWTFGEARIALASAEGITLATKTAGLAGTSTGIRVTPDAADIGALTAAGGRDTRYVIQVDATRTADDRVRRPKAYFLITRSLPAEAP